MVDPTFEVQVTSTKAIFPSLPKGEPTNVPLSIVDSTVAKFARCSAIWYFGPPSKDGSRPSLTTAHLQTSLSRTLNHYPHLSGKISWSDGSNVNNGSCYHRVNVAYNQTNDLGVLFVSATSPNRLSDFLPNTLNQGGKQRIWDPSQLPAGKLVPSIPLALSQERLPEDSPHMVVQYTTFSCSSSALSISIAHALSDAQTLSNFANDWSSISRALLSDSPFPPISALFNPRLLDEKAAGDIETAAPDPKLQREARELPMFRYDWYAESPEQPSWARRPQDFPVGAKLSPSIPIPWEQWDLTKPVTYRIIHFSQSEISKLHEEICSSGRKTQDQNHDQNQSQDFTVSKHDAVLAHLWSRINTAREHSPETQTHMNLSLGLRSRLNLPSNFVGSPIMLAGVSASASTTPLSPSSLAAQINNTTQKFTADAISKVLHDEAFEVDPQRLWRGCLGREHLMVTSWVYSRIKDVDFGGGGRLAWVEPVMLPFDGLMVVMEGVAREDAVKREGTEEGEDVGKGKGKGSIHWARDGVDVCLFLEEGAMERLLRDPCLFPGAGSIAGSI